MSDVIVVRPGGDPWANDLAFWGGTVAGLFSSFPQHSLSVDVDTPHSSIVQLVQTHLARARAGFFFCHGSRDTLYDNQSTQYNLLDLSSAARARGKIIVAISCDSVHTLGPACIARGAEAYLGFDDALTWLRGDPHGKFAGAARAPCAVLLAGGTAAAAERALWSELNQTFQYYSAPPQGVAWYDAVIGKLTAWWDLAHLRLHGQGSATL